MISFIILFRGGIYNGIHLFDCTNYINEYFFIETRYQEVVKNSKLNKLFLWIQITLQMFFLGANVICLFVKKSIMPYIVVAHFIVLSIILVVFNIIVIKSHIKKLKERIIDNNLLMASKKEIRDFIKEKYNESYYYDEIENCLKRMKKAK